MFEFITNQISPIKGLQMMKAGIEKNVGHPVDTFKVTYFAEKEQIIFEIEENGKPRREPWVSANSGTLMFMIKQLCESKFAKDETLDLVICVYNPDATIDLTICFTKGTEKVKQEYKNYKP